MNVSVLAHASETNVNIWEWGQPLGIVTLMVGVALTVFLLAATIKTLASIDPEQKKRKK